jgi:transposase InsO family protein
VGRHFKAARPGQLHVADFTYVPLDGGGFGYTALVIDAFAGLIPGWDCSLSKQTAFVERAIRQAAAYRAGQGRPFDGTVIHHSDAGSQGRTPRCTSPRRCWPGWCPRSAPWAMPSTTHSPRRP